MVDVPTKRLVLKKRIHLSCSHRYVED